MLGGIPLPIWPPFCICVGFIASSTISKAVQGDPLASTGGRVWPCHVGVNSIENASDNLKVSQLFVITDSTLVGEQKDFVNFGCLESEGEREVAVCGGAADEVSRLQVSRMQASASGVRSGRVCEE